MRVRTSVMKNSDCKSKGLKKSSTSSDIIINMELTFDVCVGSGVTGELTLGLWLGINDGWFDCDADGDADGDAVGHMFFTP